MSNNVTEDITQAIRRRLAEWHGTRVFDQMLAVNQLTSNTWMAVVRVRYLLLAETHEVRFTITKIGAEFKADVPRNLLRAP